MRLINAGRVPYGISRLVSWDKVRQDMKVNF